MPARMRGGPLGQGQGGGGAREGRKGCSGWDRGRAAWLVGSAKRAWWSNEKRVWGGRAYSAAEESEGAAGLKSRVSEFRFRLLHSGEYLGYDVKRCS